TAAGGRVGDGDRAFGGRRRQVEPSRARPPAGGWSSGSVPCSGSVPGTAAGGRVGDGDRAFGGRRRLASTATLSPYADAAHTISSHQWIRAGHARRRAGGRQ